MLKRDVIAHFGSQAELARFLGIKPPSIQEWGDIIPEGQAYKLQVLTAGALRVDPAMYVRKSTECAPGAITGDISPAGG